MTQNNKYVEGGQGLMIMVFRASREIAVTALAIGALCPPVFGQDSPSPALSYQASVVPIHALSKGSTFTATVDYRNVSSSDLTPVFEDIKTQTDSVEPPAAQAGLKRAVEVHIRGKLELSVIGRERDEQLVQLRMPSPKVSLLLDGFSADAEAGDIARCLANGVVSAFSTQGKVIRVWIKPEFGTIAASTVRTLFALAQFVLPEIDAKNAEFWEAQEEDQTGKYTIRYSRDAGDGGTISFKKEKIVFLPPKTKKSRARNIVLPVAYQPHGGMVVSFDTATGQLLSITGSESYDVVISGRNVGKSETSFTLKRAGLSRMAAKARTALLKEHAILAGRVQATSLWVAPSDAQADHLLYRQKLGKETTASLLAELAAADKTAAKDYTELYQKLKALIYLRPESCHRLGRIAATADQKSLTFRLLIGAMAAIGNAAAQDAIVAVMRARASDTELMMQLIPALGMFEEPAGSAEQALKEFAYHNGNGDVAFTAQLALGAMASNLLDESPVRARLIIDEFMAKYPSPTEQSDISRVILVLGNSRLEEYLPTLQKYAEDQIPEVRSDAVYALRSFTGEKVESILFRALTQDQDDTTRREAAESLGYMEASDRVFAGLKGAYANEKIDKIRIEILKSLWKFEKNFPETRQLLEQAAEKDESEEVRKAAHGILNKDHQE